MKYVSDLAKKGCYLHRSDVLKKINEITKPFMNNCFNVPAVC
jgi:hypothetical protein